MNFLLLGPPGSGKGTQGKYLEKKCSIKSISTGELLRGEVKKKSEIGKQIQDILGKGQFVSDEIVLTLLKKNITKSEYKNGFILDGYPRNINQAQTLDTMLKELNKKIAKVFYFHIKDSVLIERICNRYYCANCNANYNKLYKNTKVEGVCDECGSTNLQVRADDNVETVKKRLQEYTEQTSPLISYYKNRGILNKIDSTKDIGEISKEIDLILKK
jgi:adenylate kinase